MTDARQGRGPTVLRMILARQLQALREKAGLSYEQAAEAIYASSWTIRRMERAEGALKPLSVKALLVAYGVTDAREIDTFLALAREASKPGWWHRASDVLPAWFRVSLGLEEAAALIRGYEPQCVPGLLQTEADARALITQGHPGKTQGHPVETQGHPRETQGHPGESGDSGDTAAEADRLVQVRMTRQQVLLRPHPPKLWMVLDETVLRRPVGGPAVMRAQLGRLIDAAAAPNITLQVLPYSAGPHPAMYGMFHLFRFPDGELPDIVYGEHLTSAFYLDNPADAAAYRHALDRICAQAAPAGQTAEILTATLKEY